MHRWVVLLAALWVAPAASQQPAFQTPNFHIGNGFYELCARAQEGPVRSACFAYVQGAHDMLNWERGTKLCYGPGVTMQQIYDLLLKAIADDPRKGNFPTIGVLEMTLSEKFKCP
jgi:hypothetical protein